MTLGRVVGSIWCSAQYAPFNGKRLVLVVPWDALSQECQGSTVVAADAVGCRTGDIVTLLAEGGGARQVLGDSACPAEAVVVGIVDRVSVECAERQPSA